MKPLEPPDSTHLEAAQGWLALGNHLAANEELERIKPRLRSHPDVLEARWHICAHARKWEACVAIAAALVKLAPERPDGWLHRSHALHELARTQEAFDSLVAAADEFPKVWTIPYNLACYCVQLGRCNEAKGWFTLALAIASSDEEIARIKLRALDDPELRPLRDSLKAL
jgi:hypothetical protein